MNISIPETKLITLLLLPIYQIVIFQSGEGGSSARVSSRRTGEEPHIGKYRLLKTIGKGNFAKVKLAKHIPTGKEVRKSDFNYLFIKKIIFYQTFKLLTIICDFFSIRLQLRLSTKHSLILEVYKSCFEKSA